MESEWRKHDAGGDGTAVPGPDPRPEFHPALYCLYLWPYANSWCGGGIVRPCVMRCVVFAVLTLALGACAKRDPIVSTAGSTASGNWQIERQMDRVTGAPIASARLLPHSSSHSAVSFPQLAELQLTCFQDQPIVRLAFEVKVGSNRNSTLGYHFDQKPGRDNVDSRFLQDFRTVVIEDKADVAKFVDELASSNVLYVRIRSLNTGRTATEFRVDGAPAAIEAGFSACPLKSGPARRTAEARR